MGLPRNPPSPGGREIEGGIGLPHSFDHYLYHNLKSRYNGETGSHPHPSPLPSRERGQADTPEEPVREVEPRDFISHFGGKKR